MRDFAATLGAVSDAGSRAWLDDIAPPRGRRTDDVALELISLLARCYEDATGRRAGRSTTPDGARVGGPFVRFVRAVYDWIGPPYSEKTNGAIAGDLRRARKVRRLWPET